MKKLLVAFAVVACCAACNGRKLAALEAADSPGLMKLPLWALPGEDKGLLAAIGADEEHVMKVVLELAARSSHAARLRCHALQTEAVDLLVIAKRADRTELDAEGNVETSGISSHLGSERLIADRNYTLRRSVDGNVLRLSAFGRGEMAGDEWKIEVSTDRSQWMEAARTAPTVVKDACAAK